MPELSLTILFLLAALVIAGCGGGGETEEDAQRSESSRDCETVCSFGYECNSREPEGNECAQFCDTQVEAVSGDCLELYAKRMSCRAANLNCNGGEECEAEDDAYYGCELSDTSSPPTPDQDDGDGPGDGPGNF